MDWESEEPERLFQLCLDFCVKNPSVLCAVNDREGNCELRDGEYTGLYV